MVRRIAVSLLLGFIVGTNGLVFFPDLARVVGLFVCSGDLYPDRSAGILQFRCRTSHGNEQPLAMNYLVPYVVLGTSAILLFPVHVALCRSERRFSAIQQAIARDIATSVTARAEVLQANMVSSPHRALLLRAAEVEVVLWVYPPDARPYEGRATWLVDLAEISALRHGRLLRVRINPLQPQRVYPAEQWATYLWTDPAPIVEVRP